MELRSDASQNPFTSDTAAQALDYLRGLAQQAQAAPEGVDNTSVLKTYAHMANSQANLLAEHQFNDQAEQAYRLATSLWPDNVEAVEGYSQFLARQGRGAESAQLLDEFGRNYPKQRAEIDVWRGSITTTAPPSSK
jgi:Tfp pilus assembly protein PilF